MSINRLIWLAIALAAFTLGGCSSTGNKDTEGTPGEVVEGSGSNTPGSTSTSGATPGSKAYASPLDDPNSPLATRKVYFDYDRSEIRSDSMVTLRAHAQFLVSNHAMNLSIEGHADERGSREHNIALGERRAIAVKRFLEAEGVSPSQITTISYGEESPENYGHNEAAWAVNRRAVLAY